MASSSISARLEREMAEKLENLARATKRSKSFIVAEAIQKYLDEQSWQVEAIRAGLEQADRGEFADESDVKNFFKQWDLDEA